MIMCSNKYNKILGMKYFSNLKSLAIIKQGISKIEGLEIKKTIQKQKVWRRFFIWKSCGFAKISSKKLKVWKI